LKKRIAFWVGGLAIVAVLAVLYLLNPVEQPLMPKCPFKLLTGLSCPGCGFQRAMHAALHGHWLEALSYNYWFTFALPYFAAVVTEKWVLRGRWKQKAEAVVEHPILIYTYVTTFFLWFVIRNILHI
jgi:hypothetical protein